MDRVVGFAPDADPMTPGVLTDCLNLIPCDVGMRAVSVPTDVGVSPLPDEVRGALLATDAAGNRPFVVGTKTGLYVPSGDNWADVSGEQTILLGRDEYWAMTQLGNDIVVAAPSVGLSRAAAGAPFATVDGAPQAKALVSLKGFVVAFNTDDPSFGASPDRWWCSAFLDVTDWTPDVATQCTTGRLVESGGAITAAERLGDTIAVYKRRSLFLGRYTGPAEVWNFQQIDSGVGCVGVRAVCDTGRLHYFLGVDDIYAFNGVDIQSIGRGLVRDWYSSNRSPEHMHKSIAHWDPVQQLAWFFFVSADSGDGALDTALVYSPATGRWGRADGHLQGVARYATPASTYDGGSDIIDTYDSGPRLSYDTPFWRESQETMAGFSVQNNLVTFSSAPDVSGFTTGDYGTEGLYTQCTRFAMRVVRSPLFATATGYTKDDGGVEAKQASVAMRNDAAFDMRQRARWHRFSVEATGDMVLTGIEPTLKPAGVR